VGDDELDRILRDELPALEVLGVERDGVVLAFAATASAPDSVTIEYIAVAQGERGRGLGGRLVHAIRARAARRPLRALTDDDAVDFYRRLGFAVAPSATDARWPDRRRYECILAPPV
jgi:GNAT superfamily N-acetyltransferase